MRTARHWKAGRQRGECLCLSRRVNQTNTNNLLSVESLMSSNYAFKLGFKWEWLILQYFSSKFCQNLWQSWILFSWVIRFNIQGSLSRVKSLFTFPIDFFSSQNSPLHSQLFFQPLWRFALGNNSKRQRKRSEKRTQKKNKWIVNFRLKRIKERARKGAEWEFKKKAQIFNCEIRQLTLFLFVE